MSKTSMFFVMSFITSSLLLFLILHYYEETTRAKTIYIKDANYDTSRNRSNACVVLLVYKITPSHLRQPPPPTPSPTPTHYPLA